MALVYLTSRVVGIGEYFSELARLFIYSVGKHAYTFTLGVRHAV